MLYWDPTHADEEEPESEAEETRGCFTLLGYFLIIGFGISLTLVAIGVIIQWITHFADYQTKLIWLAASLISGSFLAALWTRKRRRFDKHRSPVSRKET